MTIKITCCGSRGSLPTPSRAGRNGAPDFLTMGYGGNTSCYHIEAGPFSIICDMGSGISNLSSDMFKDGRAFKKEHIVLLSHYHWDHLQGGPFFGPFFIPSNKFHFHGFAPAGMEATVPFDRVVEHLLSEQQISPHFPVAHGSLPAKKDYHTHQRQFSESFWYYIDEQGRLEFQHEFSAFEVDKGTLPELTKANPKNWVKITTVPLNHPDGCLGFRVDYMGKSVVYATDNEPLRHPNAQLVKASKGASWLLLDGQYDEGRLGGMTQTFGHGSPRACVDQAAASELAPDGLLVIHHHDPVHDDSKLYEMELDAFNYAAERGVPRTSFAREGDTWVIE